jgi:hypothetical protein
MPDLGEFRYRLASDALCGRFGDDELRVFQFEFAKFRHQPVVLGIRDFRVVKHVVAVIVVFNLGAELQDAPP